MASVSNKDEARHCIAIAQSALAAGKYHKAKKYLLKAQRLYPTEKAENLLARINDTVPSTSGATSPPGADQPNVRERRSSSQRPQMKYTIEQAKAVSDVLNCDDYYKLLRVSREASSEDIEKAYKKVIKLVHPDRNLAPGATQASQKVTEAKEVLTDPERRREYDAGGVTGQGDPGSTCRTAPDLSQGDVGDLLTGIAILGGALLGGYLTAKLIDYIRKLQVEKDAVVPAGGRRN